MTIAEAKNVIEQLKAQGQTEEEIAGAFYLMFVEEKIDVNQLEALINLLGFELSDQFKQMDHEQQKEDGYKVINPDIAEETSNEEENEEEKAMKLLGQKETSKSEEEKEEDKDEEEKAMKFFK